MKRNLVIFDLDGTLLDTSEGIMYSYNQTAKEFKLHAVKKDDLYKVIGGPLQKGFKTLYRMDDQTIEQAVLCYRRNYAEKGKYMATIYDGIQELLVKIKKSGMNVAVATLKHEMFAEDILNFMGLIPWIDVVFGTDDSNKRTKAYLIKKAMERFGCRKSETILIGDSYYDAKGAEKAGIDFIGVTYGWGFTCKEDLLSLKHYAIAENADQIFDML